MIDNQGKYHAVSKEMLRGLSEGKAVILDNQKGWKLLMKVEDDFAIGEDGKFVPVQRLVKLDLSSKVCPPAYLENCMVFKVIGSDVPMKCGHVADWFGYGSVGCRKCGFDTEGVRRNNELAFEVDWEVLEM